MYLGPAPTLRGHSLDTYNSNIHTNVLLLTRSNCFLNFNIYYTLFIEEAYITYLQR